MMDLSPDLEHRLLTARDASAGVSTDTRADLAGKMFFALKGDNFDGNAFVQHALDSGATHAVTTDVQWQHHPSVTVVPEELGALQQLARAYRRRWTCPVLGLTGSNGKTTTKELIRDVLATQWDVHATAGNFNNHIGVPLTLLNAPKAPGFVVVEMGANHQKEIALLSDIAEPTHGYITNIGLAHLEGFGGEEGVYRGKKELFDHLATHGGTAFVQRSDEKVVRASADVQERVDVPTSEWRWHAEAGTEHQAHIQHPDGQTFPMHLEGSYNLPNVVAAVVIGDHFGVPWNRAQHALSDYVPSNHRSQAVDTGNNWVLLDAYNANPSSMTFAVNDFAARKHASPWAILGDMAELGDASAEAHERLAHLALDAGLELWTVGTWFGRAKAKDNRPSWRHFDAHDTLVTTLKDVSPSGRQILVKGSRSAGLERLLPYL